MPGIKPAKTAAAAPASGLLGLVGRDELKRRQANRGGGSSNGEAGSKSGASEAPASSEEKTSQAKKPSKPAKQTVYHVAVLFGVAPAGTPRERAR